jgi:hypothetical protein
VPPREHERRNERRGGVFWGQSEDPLGLLRESDFAAVRLRLYL